jgi:hypothetical protein
VKLAVLLLAIIVGAHYSADHFAQGYGDPAAASRALFYILRGLEGSALFVVIAILARHRWVSVVCLFGLFEESQTAICRAARPIGERPAVELFKGLCGDPWYGVGLIVAVFIASTLLDKLREGQK